MFGNLNYEVMSDILGGSRIDDDLPKAPYDIMQKFNEWYETIHNNNSLSGPQKMKIRKWYEIKEV